MIRSHLFLCFLSSAKRNPSLDSQILLRIGFLVFGRKSTCQICRYDKNSAGSYTLCSQRRRLSVFLENKIRQFISAGYWFKLKAIFFNNSTDWERWAFRIMFFLYLDKKILLNVWFYQQGFMSVFFSVRLIRMFRWLVLLLLPDHNDDSNLF